MDNETIAFGMDRETDERSLVRFVLRFARPGVLAALAPRLDEAEILALVDTLSLTLKKHLTDREYHLLFLRDDPAGEKK